jgi:hypothetical protein
MREGTVWAHICRSKQWISLWYVATALLNSTKAIISDNVMTGSSNKAVYEANRRHVISVMEGWNAVIFAYGQTASGKTFTLV